MIDFHFPNWKKVRTIWQGLLFVRGFPPIVSRSWTLGILFMVPFNFISKETTGETVTGNRCSGIQWDSTNRYKCHDNSTVLQKEIDIMDKHRPFGVMHSRFRKKMEPSLGDLRLHPFLRRYSWQANSKLRDSRALGILTLDWERGSEKLNTHWQWLSISWVISILQFRLFCRFRAIGTRLVGNGPFSRI